MDIAFYLLVGTILLWAGAELLVRSGASLALRIGVPIMAIGLTVLGFGTGMPELVVSVQASLMGKTGITLGNVIGSNIVNSTLILGIAALFNPIAIKSKLVQHDLPIMLFTTLVLTLIILTVPTIGIGVGICFVFGLISYTYFSFLLGRQDIETINEEKEEIEKYKMKNTTYEVLGLLVGFVILFFGGKLFLDGAISFAKLFNMSDEIIGVTVVAFGTSLPELVVSVVAGIKKHGDVSIGNIVGSNIFNILGILGIVLLYYPIQTSDFELVPLFFLTFLSFLMWIFARTDWLITRFEGGILLCSYIAFVVYSVMMVA